MVLADAGAGWMFNIVERSAALQPSRHAAPVVKDGESRSRQARGELTAFVSFAIRKRRIRRFREYELCLGFGSRCRTALNRREACIVAIQRRLTDAGEIRFMTCR